MERSRTKLFLMLVCLLVLSSAYLIWSHKSSKVKPSAEMKTGMKALANPESLVKDLE